MTTSVSSAGLALPCAVARAPNTCPRQYLPPLLPTHLLLTLSSHIHVSGTRASAREQENGQPLHLPAPSCQECLPAHLRPLALSPPAGFPGTPLRLLWRGKPARDASSPRSSSTGKPAASGGGKRAGGAAAAGGPKK